MLHTVSTIFIAFMAGFLGTMAVRRYALGRGLMDHPGSRSSHTQPTPRGGGVAIIAVTVAGALWVGGGYLPWMWGLAAALVAIAGLVDDHGHVPARWRLGVHLAAAILLVSSQPLPSLNLIQWPLTGWWAGIFWALLIVWFINLFNFMDGINGLAAGQTIFVCAALLGLGYTAEPSLPLWLLLPLLGATLGFLPWNCPRARIFMGDGGSGFIGFCLASVCLLAGREEYAWAVLILMGTFVVDATVTLLRRLAFGERVYNAHRTHAYQYAARRYGAHWIVTLGYAVINLLWSLPWAWAAVSGRVAGFWALLGSYTLLAVVVWCYRAGVPERRGLT